MKRPSLDCATDMFYMCTMEICFETQNSMSPYDW